jgi:hypothetical protein
VTLAQIELYRHRFPGPRAEMVLASIEAGNTDALLWEIPQAGAEPILVLWDQGNDVFYLAGDTGGDAAVRALVDALDGEVLATARAAGVRYAKLCPLTPSLRSNLTRLVPVLALTEHRYLFYVHAPAALPEGIGAVPAGIHLAPITPQALDGRTYAGSEVVREEIRGMWPSEERFFQNGFGVVAIKGDEIVCWCTAEYLGPTHCGIGIATRSDQERKGIATAVTVRFVEEARRRGLTPCWECNAVNTPSVRVAEKTGFVLRGEETYWIGSLAQG